MRPRRIDNRVRGESREGPTVLPRRLRRRELYVRPLRPGERQMAYQRESRLDVINLSQKCQRGIHGYRQTFDQRPSLTQTLTVRKNMRSALANIATTPRRVTPQILEVPSVRCVSESSDRLHFRLPRESVEDKPRQDSAIWCRC